MGSPIWSDWQLGTALFSLERTQKIDDFLLLLSSQPIEMFDDLICLAGTALVISDSVHEVGGPSVMQEEDALSDAPEGSCAEAFAIELFSYEAPQA